MATALTLIGGAAGCGTGPDPGPRTIRVPEQVSTIAKAVAQARPGDVILAGPGRYRERVRLDKPRLTLRGTDRNQVIIDGEGKRSDGVVVTASGVTVENLTVTRHLFNGVLVTGMTDDSGLGVGRGSDGYQRLDPARFPPVRDFAVRYVTAYNNGLYGIYAFDATAGVIEDNYASGSADSGFYVGQCKPCDTMVRRNVAEHNAIGFENANASGGLYIIGNRFSRNRVGATITSNYQEALLPQERAVLAGNLISENADPDSPAHAEGGFGIGVGLSGARDNLISRNRIAANPTAGLIITSAEDLPPIGNRVEANIFQSNTLQLGYAASTRAPGQRNCLAGNTGLPEPETPCLDGPGTPYRQPAQPPGRSFLELPTAPPQPQLTADAAKWTPPTDADLAALPIPGPDLFTDRIGLRP